MTAVALPSTNGSLFKGIFFLRRPFSIPSYYSLRGASAGGKVPPAPGTGRDTSFQDIGNGRSGLSFGYEFFIGNFVG